MPSPEEIQELKDNWRRDPCWDIEDTEGFEEHREELLAYSLEMKAHWKEQAEKHHDELATMYCPLLSAGSDGMVYCTVERCAWWDETYECCSIRALFISH